MTDILKKLREIKTFEVAIKSREDLINKVNQKLKKHWEFNPLVIDNKHLSDIYKEWLFYKNRLLSLQQQFKENFNIDLRKVAWYKKAKRLFTEGGYRIIYPESKCFGICEKFNTDEDLPICLQESLKQPEFTKGNYFYNKILKSTDSFAFEKKDEENYHIYNNCKFFVRKIEE